MDRKDVLQSIEADLSSFDERDSGNLISSELAARLRPLAAQYREAVVAALRHLLSHRAPHDARTERDLGAEARLWLAASLAEEWRLIELVPDLERLISDVEAGRVLLPVHADMLRSRMRMLKSL